MARDLWPRGRGQRLRVKVKSPDSLPVSRTAETSFPSVISLSTSARERPHPLGDQPHRPDRDPCREADQDVDHFAVQVIRSAGVEAPGVVPVQGDAITAPHDRVLEQLGCQARVVVVHPVQELRTYRAHIPPLQDRELDGLSASGTEREEPGIEELVVCVDAKFSVRPETLRRASVATAENGRQAGGHDHPAIEHRSTPVPVRSPQQEAARRACATATNQRSGRLTGCTTARPCLGESVRQHGNGSRRRSTTRFRAPHSQARPCGSRPDPEPIGQARPLRNPAHRHQSPLRAPMFQGGRHTVHTSG